MTSQSLSRFLDMGRQPGTLALTRRGFSGPPQASWCMRRYMLTQSAVFVLGLLVLTGCATAYQPPSLATDHPAHPEATAAPQPPPSKTLAYGPPDIPSPQPAGYMAQRGTGSEPEAQNAVVGKGKVIAVVPSSGQLVVDHKAIKGFMEAMTMGYRTDPPALLKGVKAGDEIRFTIDTKKNAIVKIENLKP